ncbi:TPA: hypothetical protein QDB15_000133 [Burkholderia vietnamiensis]|uniref:Uncharacterized protein n=1 Tax=Pandoraea apista TaxID=93218 RepID=A0A5E5P186_9BURK|nr:MULTISPECIES: hypothetical protein [Burkholderiaceae]MCA8206407.1 hypothetical protein [Burkholderia vietnamiensis]VVG70321.1 hypothetical protein PAP18089_01281 [Pandoraea apista]HDR8943205.1 hypothetical protein [Burkholderia vietnamiensis]HDR9116409.1 hypothetical protein [Burkholderia vietnamiensis]HDR9205455.1 hypothetical protein [Burkholderia vietnamiensis]
MTTRNGYTPEGLYDFSIQPDEELKAMIGKPIEALVEMLEAILVMLTVKLQSETIALQAEQIRQLQQRQAWATAKLVRARKLEADGVTTVPRDVLATEPQTLDVDGRRIDGGRRKFSMADVRASRGPRIDPAERTTEPRSPTPQITVPSARSLGNRLDTRSTTARFEPTSRASTLAYDTDNGVEAYRPRSRFSPR